ncbi:MAG: DUF1559 domain-containing protein [Planctomycetaceae bacterium]
MPACPTCGDELGENTRVCPACRANRGTDGSHGERDASRGGGAITFVVAAALLLVIAIAFLLPAVNGGGVSRRSQSGSNLKILGLAVHSYHKSFGSLPVAQVQRDRGTAEHGWQVGVLPFIDELQSFNAIDFDRTWDDPANAAGVGKKIPVFLNPGVKQTEDARGYPLIHYAGNVHVLGRDPASTFDDVRDGTGNTILIGEVTEGLRAWADPHDLRDPGLGLNAGPATFGSPWKGGVVQFVAVDGAVRYLYPDVPLPTLKALATPAGGEAVTFPD